MRRMAQSEDDKYLGGDPLVEAGAGGGGGTPFITPRAQAMIDRAGPKSTTLQQRTPRVDLLSEDPTDPIGRYNAHADDRYKEIDKRINKAKASAARYRKGGMVGCREYGK